MTESTLITVGASLGGLEAMSTVFRALPPDLPAAVVAIQHRQPGTAGALEAILQRQSALPVVQVEDKQPIEAGRVYTAPPDYHLLIDGDAFSLDIGEPVQCSRPSIDVTFESAAEARKSLIAVLLTASSEDGAGGIEAVARSGGVTIVQDPVGARSDVALRAALRRTHVDHVLRLPDIGPTLTRLIMHGAPTPRAAS